MKVSVLAMAATTLALAGCGQSSSQSGQAAAPPAPPAQATPDQVKTLLAELPAPYNTGDIDNGKSKFAQCAACHTTAEGGPNMTGPNLYGVFGRKAGSPARLHLFRRAEGRRLDLGRRHGSTPGSPIRAPMLPGRR